MAHDVTLREAFDDVVSDKQYQGVSPATVSFYRRNWDHVVRDTGVETVRDLTPNVIRSWLLDHQGVTPTTLATYDRSLRVTLNWFEKRGYVSESPTRGLRKWRTPRTMVDTFSVSEAQAIIKTAQQGRHPRRDVALMTLLLDTGLRIGEALGLKLEDINWREGFLQATGKTGPRVVPFGRRSNGRAQAVHRPGAASGEHSRAHPLPDADGSAPERRGRVAAGRRQRPACRGRRSNGSAPTRSVTRSRSSSSGSGATPSRSSGCWGIRRPT